MASFIMIGPLQAIGFVMFFAMLSFAFLPLMGVFSSAAIALITLRMGWQRGLWIAGVSSALLGVLTLVLQGSWLSGGLGGLFDVLNGTSPPKFFGLQLWLPVIALAAMLSRTVNWSKTLNALLLASSGAVVLFFLGVGNVAEFWQEQAFWPRFVEMGESLGVFPSEMAAEQKQQVLSGVAEMLAGCLAAGANLFWVLSLLIARHWQSELYNAGGFQQEWHQLNIGRPAALGMIGLIVLALISGHTLLISLVFTALGLFVFQGVALVHGVIAALQQSKAWLLTLYLPLMLLPMQVGILLAAFGIIDAIADFRRQIKARKD